MPEQGLQLNSKKLERALVAFREYAKEPRFAEDVQERYERIKFFQEFSRKQFDELGFSEMLKKLWAARIWGNKDYLVNQIIKNNGIEKIRVEYLQLISRRETPGERYEKFLNSVKGMGPSMVTELLCYNDSKNAGIWNNLARRALAWLEVKNIPYWKYRISGEEYDIFNKSLGKLANRLEQGELQNGDLLFVDYFLWETWDKLAKHERIELLVDDRQTKGASKHDEFRDKVAQIGSWLGFETETEKLIAPGAKVDAIWRARIANLGAVSYIFEVQDRGSIDSLVLNLQRAQHNPTVQKLIIVSDTDQIAKIQKEVQLMPETFRKVLTYWDIYEIENTYQSLEQVTLAITKLHLVED